MNTDIRYIFLDLGGTFRVIDEDPAYLAAARAKIAELCGVKTEDPTQWFEDVIDKRYDVYREWALKYMCEAPEEVLWRRWLAYDCDPELIRRNASELCYQYRQTKGRRVVVDGGVEVIKGLHERGYKLGIISNLIGENEVPDWLEEDGLDSYFDTVILSSVCHMRKPCSEIYDLACQQIGVKPEECVSVADNIKRDIAGAKKAGIGCNIIFRSPEKKHPVEFTEETRPDAVIDTFPELLELLPPLK